MHPPIDTRGRQPACTRQPTTAPGRVQPAGDPALPAVQGLRLGLAIALTLAALGPTSVLARGSGEDPGRLPPVTAAPDAAVGTRAGMPSGAPPRLEVSGEPTPGAYILRVKVGGGRPEAVQVVTRGQALDLALATGSVTESSTGGDGPQGSAARWGSDQGWVRRRVPLPADADLGRLTREYQGDTLVLRVPRRPGGARPGAPARPAGER